MIQSSNPVLLNISFVVVVLHLILFGWMAFSSEWHPIQKTSRHLVVKTISLQPRAPSQAMEQEISVKKKVSKENAIIKKEQPKPKQETKPKPKPMLAPKPEPKAKAVENKPKLKSSDAKVQSLLAQAQTTMEKVQKNQGKVAAVSLPIPQLFQTKEKLTIKETGYQDELAGLLKLLLRLPEYGRIDIELTLDRSGKIKKMKVLESESKRNRSYIEKAILTIAFPAFGGNFSGVSEYTFHLQLDNR